MVQELIKVIKNIIDTVDESSEAVTKVGKENTNVNKSLNLMSKLDNFLNR